MLDEVINGWIISQTVGLMVGWSGRQFVWYNILDDLVCKILKIYIATKVRQLGEDQQ